MTANLKVLLVALSVLLLVLSAACGGDDDDDSEDNGGSDVTASAEPEDPTDDAEPADDGGDDDGEDDNGDVSTDHACSIVTPEEVSAAVGFEVGEGRDYLAVAANATQCEWQSSDESGTVYAEVLTEGGRDWYEAVTFGFDEPDNPLGGEEVEGIGDQAVYDSLSLQVVDGDKYVSVQVVLFFSDLDELTATKALAQAILEKL